MNAALSTRLDAFTGLCAVALGEAMLDSYLHGTSRRRCREGAAPVLDVEWQDDFPGGAANTAANLGALGARVRLLSAIGRDHEGRRLCASLRACGVPTANLYCARGRTTLTKQRLVAEGRLMVRFDRGSTGAIDPIAETWLASRLTAAWQQAQAVVISDYAYGVLTPALVTTLERLQATTPRVLVVDARHPTRYAQVGATVVKPNFAEAAELLEEPLLPADRVGWVEAHCDALLARTGAALVAVTLDSEGAIVCCREQGTLRIPALACPECHPVGAGDTFAAALALALAAGAGTEEAMELATVAAGVAVSSPGTARCSLDALRTALTANAPFSLRCGGAESGN